MEPKLNDVHVDLSDVDGNAFSIMGRVMKAIREAGYGQEEVDKYKEAAMSGDYDNLLRVTMDTVHVEMDAD